MAFRVPGAPPRHSPAAAAAPARRRPHESGGFPPAPAGGAVNLLRQRLGERGVLMADGGIGTGLFARGLESGESPEIWNLEHPDAVRDLHREFLDAGADILLTNSFGANRFRLALHGRETAVAELCLAAAALAREAAARSDRRVVVAGSMGPTGEVLQPVGSCSPAAARDAFFEQAEALARGGVDLLWIETVSSAEELEVAVEAAAATGLPVVATMSFDTGGRTMMGITPEQAIMLARGLVAPPVAFGANCGTGPAGLVAAILAMRRVAAPGEILVAKANCGIPVFEDGAVRYSGTPEVMGRYARLARAAGARIIGGCCGTTGEHLRAMRAALDLPRSDPPPDPATIERLLGTLPAAAAGRGRTRPRRRRRRAPG